MSSTSTRVTEEHFAYLAARTAAEDPLLAELKRTAEAEGVPPIWISPEQASLLQILLKAAGTKRVVEVGTLAGYSAIAMARALPADGRLLTLELVPAHAELARRFVARSDVAERVEVVTCDASEHLPTLADRSADAMFIDADKAGYGGYLEQALRIVRPGGLVLVDNAFAFGSLFDEGEVEDSVRAIRAFNDRMAATPGVHGVIVPIGDGLWVGVIEGERAEGRG